MSLSNDQLEKLERVLNDMDDIREAILHSFGLLYLKDLPEEKYQNVLEKAQTIKDLRTEFK